MNIDEALEQTQWDLFWLPPSVRVVDRPELLYLSSSEPDDYLNSVLRVRASDDRADALVLEVAAAHGPRKSRWMLTPQSRTRALERALSNHGYGATHEHLGYWLDGARHRARAVTGISVRAITTVDDVRAAVSVMSSAFGRGGLLSEERLAAEVAMCARPGARVHRFVAWAGDQPVATGGMNAFPSLDLAFFWGGSTIAEARGRGAYSALLDARIARARELGISRVGVYARENTSAPIVARRGFQQCGRMTYWERPGA